MARSGLRRLGSDWREAGVWLASRLTNGLLALLQLTLAAAAIGPHEAGRFFVLWTSTWLLATAMKFGADAILPRVVAEAGTASADVPSLLRPLLAGLATCLIAVAPLLAAFHVAISPTTLLATVALATCWAGTLVLSGALKAHGRVGLSGIVANTLWSVGPALAPLFLLGPGGDWQDLLLVTLAAAAVAFAISALVTSAALGGRTVLRLVGRGRPRLPIESDVVGAAVLSFLYELMLWLPVVVIALANVGGVIPAAVFAAVRVSSLVSWPYNAIVALLTPRIAAALSARELAPARRVLVRGSLAGVAVTAPLAVGVAVAAGPILGVFDHSYKVLAAGLSWLVVGRIFDAAAGPVGEALMVGRRTWLDSILVAAGITTGLVLGLTLEPSLGATAAGIAGASAWAVTNLLRLVVVDRLLAHGWRGETRLTRGAWEIAAGTVLLSGVALAVWVYEAGLDTRRDVWLAITASLLAAAGGLGLGTARHRLRIAAASPLGVLTLILLAHFLLRPVSLVVDPGSATFTLRAMGFPWVDVTQATALGAAGLGLFAAGFAVAWRPSRMLRSTPDFDIRRLTRAVVCALVLGTALWAVLFRRLGGVSALGDDPSSVHLSQFGAGYGTFGLALCMGCALVGLQAWLARPRRRLLVLAVIAAGLALGGSVALATRGMALSTGLAAVVLVLRAKAPRGRTLLVAAACVILLGTVGVLLRAVRDYSQYEPVADTPASIVQTPPLRLLSPDVIEFDYLVVLRRFVPRDLDWLDGSSLADAPGFFVPRKLWPGKPRPVDLRFSQELFGPTVTAGTPFTLPGEAWWNLNLGGALAFLLAFGAGAGLVWRRLLERGRAAGELVAAVLTGYSYLLFTRPLGPMLLLMGTAAVAVLAVYVGATARLSPRALRAAHPSA